MPRKKKTTEDGVLEKAIKYWVRHHSSTDSLKIAADLRLDHETVKAAMVTLEEQGIVTLRRDVTLNPMTFGKHGMEFLPPVQCHVIFISQDVLTENFYSSGLVREDRPVYEERGLKGTQPYSFLFFQEEVLRKYITRPDLYNVQDTVSGGHITYTGDDESLYIHVRHGRRKLVGGRSVLAVYVVDLKRASEAEQRYWHGFELIDPVFTKEDKGFADFLDVSLGGKWIAYQDPLSEAVSAIKRVNDRLGRDIFRRTENTLLHATVENTERAFCDACGELHKLIGNDSLNKTVIESFLVDQFCTDRSEFIHKESKRPLSGLQLLQLIEDKAGTDHEVSKTIKMIGEDRGRAAHALDFKGDSNKIYIDMFREHCVKLARALDNFSENVAEFRSDDARGA